MTSSSGVQVKAHARCGFEIREGVSLLSAAPLAAAFLDKMGAPPRRQVLAALRPHFVAQETDLLPERCKLGLAQDPRPEVPITQAELRDAMGITRVHINRVLQAIRADGLIELKGDWLAIPDWDRLKEVGEFDPTYLHLVIEQPAA